MPKKKDNVDWKDMENGYGKYQAYLKSDEWKLIALKIRERDKVCKCCRRTEDQEILTVHHSTYKHLYDELNHMDDLILLCKVCHKAIHSAKSNFNRFKQTKTK